jgi:hypothetical protein
MSDTDFPTKSFVVASAIGGTFTALVGGSGVGGMVAGGLVGGLFGGAVALTEPHDHILGPHQ